MNRKGVCDNHRQGDFAWAAWQRLAACLAKKKKTVSTAATQLKEKKINFQGDNISNWGGIYLN